MEIQTSRYAVRQARLVDELGINLSLREWQSSLVSASFNNAVLHKRSAPSFEVGSEVERYHQRQPNICTCGEIGSTRYLEVVVLRRGGSNPLRCTILVLMYTNGRV